MAFSYDIDTVKINSGSIRGIQVEVSCSCWFTSGGRSMPLMLEISSEENGHEVIDHIHTHSSEEKVYSEMQVVEYDCTIQINYCSRRVKLIFFKEDGRWMLIYT